ncbi:nuclear pore protein 84/107 [Meredithblackwellia eburnea MCA 4105]
MTATVDVYVSFAQQLQQAQQGNLDLLDDQDGLLVRWGEICDQKLQTLSADLNPLDVEAWTLERNTWQLVQALYAERLSQHRESTPTPFESSSQGSTSKNPYTSPLTVVQKIIEANRELAELAAIRDWLHSIPTSLNPAEIRRGYLTYTKNRLKQAKRTGGPPPRGIVDELDPDVTLRQGGEGKRLDADDAAYDRALIRSLYEYVRAGELDLAIDMCRQSDQSWRAASLSGGQLWWDPETGNSYDEEGYPDMMGDDLETEKRAKGNVRRKVWKRMCRKLAAAPHIDPYERALYGAISGDAASVLPVCQSWEDHIWVYLNALFESRIEAALHLSSEGRYWIRGSVAPIQSTTLDAEDPLFGSAARDVTGTGIKRELEGIFDRLLRLEGGELAESAKDPYHVAQTHLIVGQVGGLVETFVERLEGAATETDPETLARLLRFFSHLILVLRLLKQPLPEYAANRVLEAYVQVLEANDQEEDLIAFYASNLDQESAIESYARFLLTFGPDSDKESRRAALLKATEHGLDVAKIACRTVEYILADIREDLPILEFNSPFDAYARLDPRQLELIRSLEWLTFDPSTYAEALTQANALARYFLATDKPHAARELLFQLPSDLLLTWKEAEQSQVDEYANYREYFACLDRHSRWAEIWARKPRSNASKIDVSNFKDGVCTLVDDFYQAVLTLLGADWLKLDLDPEDPISSGRLQEHSVIRQQLVPHLVLRLHHTLYDTSDLIPTNLGRALDLANTVADEKLKIYVEFVGEAKNRLGEYLEQVREASLAALEKGVAFTK